MPKIAEIFPVFSGFFPHFYSFFTNCGEKKLAAIHFYSLFCMSSVLSLMIYRGLSFVSR